MRLFFAVLALMPLAGCIAVAQSAPDTNDTCGAAALQGLIGQSEGVIAAMTFPPPVRIIQPDQPVTMDYYAERLNIWIDQTGRIERITCG